MRNLKVFVSIILFFTGLNTSFSQDYSNKGKDFWVVYTAHIDATTSRMALYITSDQNATGTLTVGGSTLTFTVTANQVTTLRLTNTTTPNNSLAYNSQTAGVGTNKGIHIVTDKAVVVYAHILNAARSGSTLVFPTNVLGREYYVSSYASVTGNNSRSQFAVVATEDNTTVEITPTLADANNTYPANIPFQVVLNKGDVFQYQSPNSTDLTGTLIKSIASSSAPCKPIAVFAGSTFTTMGCTNAGSGDNLYQQLFPLTSWGQFYVTAPFALRSYDIFRVMVKDPTTIVQVNGVTLNPGTLVNNSFYEFNTIGDNTSRIITSDKPICVVQYMITQACDGVSSDPEMILLNPIEQTLNDITVLSARNDLTPPNTNITRHFLNIVIKTTGLSSLQIDGASYIAAPVAIPNTPYSYLQEEVTTSTLSNPSHRIYSDSGFVAIAYGYGNVESYGYNAGTNIRDLYQFVFVQNEYATVPFPAACKNSPFYFAMVFPYQPTQIIWDFNGLFPNVTINNPVFDSTWVVNGRQLYRYKLPTPYSISTAGTYPIKVLAQNPTPDGCSGEQEINYDLQVFDPPVADFNFNTVCFPNSIQFTDISNTGGRPVINRFWDFGDASTANTNNPSHSFATAGTYNVKYALITDVGCLSDTTIHPVTLHPLPTASITGTTIVCQNATTPFITFTGADGSAPYTFTYTINGGIPQTISTTTGNSINLSVPTGIVGNFIYTLVSVSDASPAVCAQNQTGAATVTVTALPTATISGSSSVCKDATGPVLTFSAINGFAPYTFTYTINGGSPQIISTTTGNTVSLQVPTTTVGSYTYTLVSVQEGSSNLCSQAQTGSATIIVNPLPIASISGDAEVCQFSNPPVITFSGSNGVAPYTFTYSINGSPNQFVTSSGNIATINVPTNIAGTYVYSLLSVVDASTTLCEQQQSGDVTVIINPIPIASGTYSFPSCAFGQINFTDNSTANVGVITNWNWDFGDPSSGVLNSSSLTNPLHIYNSAGTYNLNLIVTNSKGCISENYPVQIDIHPKPKAGFIIPDVCLNDTYAQFSDTSSILSPDNIQSWEWNFGDPISGSNNNSIVQNPQHSYTAIGNYDVNLIITTNNGCKDTIQQSLFVNGSFPVADFVVTNPTTLCANDTIRLIEASTVFPGNITRVDIYWDYLNQPSLFDFDDFPYTGKVYRHLYPNFQSPLTKTFRIRYLAYSGGVCVNEKFQDITVNAAPSVQFAQLADVCLDAAPFQITAASETGGVPGTGFYSGQGITPAGIFDPLLAGPGIHQIMYTFVSTTGSCADSSTQLIKIYEPPVANFIVSNTLCETKDIIFTQTATTPEGVLTTWIWDFGDGSPVLIATNGNPVTHQFLNWGNYIVSLKVITSNGCVSTEKLIPILVNPQPKPLFAIPANLCLPTANATFINQSTIADGTGNLLSYYWDFGDPASGTVNNSTALNPSHSYVTVGPNNINLQVTSNNGCIHDTTISLNTIHPQPQASFITDLPEVCIGGSIHFQDNTDPIDGLVNNWNWNLDDGNIDIRSAFNYTYSNPGTYNVSLFIITNFGCKSTTITATITVHPYPIVNAGPDRLVLEGGQIVLQPTVSGNDLTYLWTPNLYFGSSNTIVNPTILGVEDITYTLTVTGRGTCAESDQVFIKVLKYPQVPNIFSPNGDGAHDKWEILYLESYPGCTIEVVNRYGQLVYRSVGYQTPWDGKVNGKDVPVGTYYYVIDPKNGRKRISGYVDVIR